MKKPEDSKKGLECCNKGNCKECPHRESEHIDCQEQMLKDALALTEQLECKAKPITCGECEYYGKSPMGSTLGWCRLDCKHRNAGFWCANADRRANK